MTNYVMNEIEEEALRRTRAEFGKWITPNEEHWLVWKEGKCVPVLAVHMELREMYDRHLNEVKCERLVALMQEPAPALTRGQWTAQFLRAFKRLKADRATIGELRYAYLSTMLSALYRAFLAYADGRDDKAGMLYALESWNYARDYTNKQG